MEQQITCAMDNLRKCSDAVNNEGAWSAILSHSSLKPLLHVENSIFNLASSEETDSTFYLIIMKSELGYMARYFESGNFMGFYEAIGHSYVKKAFDAAEILPYAVFSSLDVQLRTQQRNRPSDGMAALACKIVFVLFFFLATHLYHVITACFVHVSKESCLFCNVRSTTTDNVKGEILLSWCC